MTRPRRARRMPSASTCAGAPGWWAADAARGAQGGPGEPSMAACDLHILGSTIGAGWDYRDQGRAPGELALSSLVSSAALDPFTARRLPARSRRYQLAAALIEEFCGRCAAPCANAPIRPTWASVSDGSG